MKSKNYLTKIICFDTETYVKELIIEDKEGIKHRFDTNKFCLGTYIMKDYIIGTEIRKSFKNVPEFHNKIMEFINNDRIPVYIFAHNIIFDMIITQLDVLFEINNYVAETTYNKGMVFFQRLVKRAGKKEQRTKNKITSEVYLINTANYVTLPLRKIGESLNCYKGDFTDFSDKYTKNQLVEMEKYCEQDTNIIFQLIQMLKEFTEQFNVGWSMTIGSFALKVFKEKYQNDNVIITNNQNKTLKNFEKESYYGGRTENFFINKQELSECYVYDCNSMYPYVMKEYEYPIKLMRIIDEISIEDATHMMKYYSLIAECECMIPKDNKFTVIPKKTNKGLEFPTGNFKTKLTTEEIKIGIELGYIVKINKVHIYYKAKLFEKYVDDFYLKRLELQEQNNPMQLFYKLFLNNLYGKFGQYIESIYTVKIDKNYATIQQQDEPTIKIIKQNYAKNLKEMTEIIAEYYNSIANEKGLNIRYEPIFIPENNENHVAVIENKPAETAFVPISSHVTGTARAYMARQIIKIKELGNKVYYMDTDSIFTDKKIEKSEFNSTKLGEFKLEKVMKNVQLYGLKDYKYMPINYKTEEQISEIEIETTQIEGEKYVEIKKGKSKKAVDIDENYYIQQQWGGIKTQKKYEENFKKPKNEYWVKYVIKANKTEYRKGIISTTGEIIPFEYNEIDEINEINEINNNEINEINEINNNEIKSAQQIIMELFE